MTGPKKESFEDHLKVVEETVRALESENLPLEEAMAKYEAGMLAHAKCREILALLEKKIEQLVRKPDGSLAARPLEAHAEKPAPVAKKKKPEDDLPF
jgi:exodeoxyribonuclease VII small subunit